MNFTYDTIGKSMIGAPTERVTFDLRLIQSTP